MEFFIYICALLSVMSYFSATEHSFCREYVLQYHDFKTPYFFLGLEYGQEDCEEQDIRYVKIGLVFLQITAYTYRHNEATLSQYPWLRGAGLCSWQRFMAAFFYSLDLPVYKQFQRQTEDME
jgi:hypothetical protein